MRCLRSLLLELQSCNPAPALPSNTGTPGTAKYGRLFSVFPEIHRSRWIDRGSILGAIVPAGMDAFPVNQKWHIMFAVIPHHRKCKILWPCYKLSINFYG